MKRILRRIFIILPAVLLQALWLAVLLKWLAPWAAWIHFALSVLAFLFVLYLITKQDEGTYKILWLLVILSFPLPGAALYLIFGNKRTTRPLLKKLNAAGPCLPLPEGDPAAHETLEAENKRLSQTFRLAESLTGFGLKENRSAVYYPLGDEMFPVMLEELQKAERFIFVEYFIVENGRMWDSMVQILARKASEGVDVRVMYDDFGSLSTYSEKNAQQLRRLGIRCVAFNPLFFIKGTLNCRDHRKMLIIDGKVAFSGGVNLADEYINQVERFGHWKDIGFRLTGEAVYSYTRMFVQFWNAFSHDPLPEDFLAQALLDGRDVDSEKQDGYVLSYYDSPLKPDAVSNELFIDLLSQAKEYAWFYTPYLLPGQALLDAFVRAARRGVDVRIILPGIPDKKLVYRMSRSFYPVLVQAGVRIFEYTPGFVHAKASLIDGVVGTVGTVNLDYRSLFLHFENNSVFYRASLLSDLRADYLATQSKCRERTGENLETGLVRWIVDGVLRIFAPLC